MPLHQPEAEPQWPPRSPHEALMGTPGGRERLRRLAERTSPSPSPSPSRTRPSRTVPSMSSTSGGDHGLDDDAEEDEEMLQLKLQEIQAKLKLKKLQNAKAGASRATNGAQGNAGQRTVPKFVAARAERAEKLAETVLPQASVEVPASPIRRAPPKEQRSPLKVTLGIDKGLRAHDVSLKRAGSNARRPQDQLPQHERPRVAGTSSFDDAQPQRPLSFNERLALARTDEVKRQEKQKRVQNIRSTAFAMGKEEMESYKTTAAELPDLPEVPQTYSRADIVGVENKPPNGGRSGGGGYLRRSNTAPSVKGGRSGVVADDEDKGQESEKSKAASKDDASFESYSGLHLKRRILPHEVLTRSITGKKVYLMKDFLRQVKAPEWSLPDDECDIVLFAVLASKSDPKSHKPTYDSNGKERANARGKYMVMTLVDFTFELELFLFDSGFDRFWKLTPGTVLAILNPVIMPPSKGREATNKFSLVINSDCDTILEVGTARDLGYCQSVRRDGTKCTTWVNSKRTEYCEFHSNEAVSKARSARVELSGPGFGKFMNHTTGSSEEAGKPWRHNSRKGKYRSEKDREAAAKMADEAARFGKYDTESQSRVFVSRSSSSAALLDREGEFLDKLERNEALKRRIAQREREKDIVKKLGLDGVGAGRDYMQKRVQPSSSTAAAPSSAAVAAAAFSSRLHADGPPGGGMGAAALDLLARAKNPHTIDLGPAKRKRPDSATSNSTAGGTGTARGGAGSLGWGTALKDRLGKMKEGASASFPASAAASSSASRDDRSPVRKKTRFVTEKGIREAGRESLGAELSAAGETTAETASAASAGTKSRLLRRVVVEDDLDDDELLII